MHVLPTFNIWNEVSYGTERHYCEHNYCFNGGAVQSLTRFTMQASAEDEEERRIGLWSEGGKVSDWSSESNGDAESYDTSVRATVGKVKKSIYQNMTILHRYFYLGIFRLYSQNISIFFL